MKITVRLFAVLAEHYPRRGITNISQKTRAGTPLEVELSKGSTVTDLLAQLDLPAGLTKLTFVNGIAQEEDHVLQEGDEVGIFPPIAGGASDTIRIDVWLYGPLARYGRDASSATHANLAVELPGGSRIKDLLAFLALPTEERGLTFINGDLSAMPGHQPDLDQALNDQDRVAFFHLNSMWPAQYRDGAKMAPGLKEVMEDGDLFHHHSEPVDDQGG